MTWMLIPVDGFQGCSSKFSDLLYGKLFRRFRYSKLKRSERFNRLIHWYGGGKPHNYHINVYI